MAKLMMNIGVLVLTISILFCFRNPNGETQIASSSTSEDQQQKIVSQQASSLQYDYYQRTCPEAEQIIRTTMNDLFTASPSVAPQLLRLVFHDCFVGGCDASVLLDETNDGNQSEKEAGPNLTLKGFDHIETIKSKLEEACPGTVSCADTLVLAAREGVFLIGGPYYPLFTGRKDSLQTHFNETAEIPKPSDDINTTLTLFRSRGFHEKEIVSLLGSHSIGRIACEFFKDRIDNFLKTGRPDPSVNTAFLPVMGSACKAQSSSAAGGLEASYFQASLASSDPSMSNGNRFGDNHYYKNLLNGTALLFSDQQLMANDVTAKLVRSYASDDGSAFKRDFARAMVKLSHLNVLTGSNGGVRTTCSKLSILN